MAYRLEGAPVQPEARQRPHQQGALHPYIQTTRARLRLALIASIGVAILFGYVLFPPRHLTIEADGTETQVYSRQKDVSTLLSAAGVVPQVGDVLVKDGQDLNVERAVPVLIEADGRMLTWRTRAPDVQTLLDELRIGVSPYDAISYNGVAVSLDDSLHSGRMAMASLDHLRVEEPAIFLTIRRAVPLTIVEDGREISFQSSGFSVGDALNDAGIHLGPADEVFPSQSGELTAGMQISVRHAKAISLRTGDSTRIIYTQQDILEDALAEAGFNFGPDDRVEPGLDTPVQNGMTARLVRVTGRQFIEKEPVQKRTVFQSDPNLTGWDSRVVTGHDGIKYTEYRVVIEDGVEVEKTVVRQWEDPDVQNTVIYFAEASARAVDLPTGDLSVMKVERMYATWYNAASSGKPATDPAYGITASGRPLARGIVAVDPNVIPLGTKLWIPGYGFAIAADTGGGIIGHSIDLGYPDGVPVDWRTGWTDVYILGQ